MSSTTENDGQANPSANLIASVKPPALPAHLRFMRAKKTRVIVIGAGMSGLACARELRQRGYQVLVVEARDRLGGRLKGGVKTNDKDGGNVGLKTLPNSFATPDTTVLKPLASRSRGPKKADTSTAVDLGGALIHGIQDNPIFNITEQMGIPTFPVGDCLLFNESGWPVDKKKDDRIQAIFNECLEEAFRRVNTRDEDSTPYVSAPASFTISEEIADPIATSHPQNGEVEEEKKQDPENRALSPVLKISEGEETKPPANSKKGLKDALDPSASFGDIFDKVCVEKAAPTSDPLFQWHKANLEVGNGASLLGLGYKWNDDEPYGYDGDHSALKTSWTPVMEGLAEGLDILYNSPVKQLAMVVPDPPPEPPPEAIVTHGELLTQVATPLQTGTPSKAKRKRTNATTPLPSRRSRRIQGDDADARRSSRANKGQNVDRFLVSQFTNITYDENQALALLNKKKLEEEAESNDFPHTTVQVTLEDKTVLEADALVCTLPLGILKLQAPASSTGNNVKKTKRDKNVLQENTKEISSGGIIFYPPLSEKKQNAIQRLGCGLLNKCILSFPHVFWQDSDFLGLAHPATSYLVLNAAKFTNKPILSFMYGGDFAKQLESWTDNEIVGDCMEVLRIICGTRDIPKPLDYAVTRWGHERYSRMSFSYVPPGVDGSEEYKTMSEAVYDPLVPRKPVIMFAGEHTTPFHPSTIHGAFLSGIREAYRLDLVVEPEANGHMEFDDDITYQYTFGVRRLYQSVSSPVARARVSRTTGRQSNNKSAHQPSGGSPLVIKQGPRRQHRRRFAASVMNLRERPELAQSETTEEGTVANQKRQQRQPRAPGQIADRLPFSPAKRSRRSVHSLQIQGALDEFNPVPTTLAKAQTSKAETIAEKKHFASLESRTLVRALESYGHDYDYISSLVLPIFGNAKVSSKSLPQVRARCQRLIRSTVSSASASSLSKKQLSSWLAKDVFTPPPPDKKANKTKSTVRHQKAPLKSRVEGSRKSSRHQTQRELMNL